MKANLLKQMRRHRYAFRFMGVIFTIMGGVLFVTFIPLLLDPNATILYNGVHTAEVGPKLSAVLFLGGFVAVGAFLLGGSKSFFDRMFVWRQSFWYALFPSRK